MQGKNLPGIAREEVYEKGYTQPLSRLTGHDQVILI